MTRARCLALAALAGTTLLALSNGCALLTCVEDDCASVETGGSSTSSGTGGSGGATGVGGSGVAGTGAGGSGGGPCTQHCAVGACTTEACQPRCSQLPSTGREIATNAVEVFAIAELGLGGASGEATVERIGLSNVGSPTTSVAQGALVPSEGYLAADAQDVYVASSTSLRIVGGPDCSPPWGEKAVAGANAADLLFWAVGSTLEAWNGCARLSVLDIPNGPTAIAAAADSEGPLVAYTSAAGNVCSIRHDGGNFQTPPSCFVQTFAGARSVALSPNASRIFFLSDQGLWSGAASSTIAEPIASFAGATGRVAVTSAAYFVSRDAPSGEGTLLRCPADQTSECRSFGADDVHALVGAGDAVYFTMGDQLCAWQ